MNDPNRVLIFDTTLRDGEQAAGASMTPHQKVRIALLLETLGVDVIEAGFPVAGGADFEGVAAVARAVREPIVCALTRATENDITHASEALAHARRKRIHTFIATSPLHMEHKLRMTPEDVLRRVEASVEYARHLTDDVEWSAEDATRSDVDFLCQCVETAITYGATTINLPDTVGYATPEEYANLFRTVRERVPNSDKAVFSSHCHDDLGLAVANSLAAIHAGARQVECTINGIGERAGNAAMEEIVMALRVRQATLPYRTGISPRHFLRASHLVSAVSGFVVQPNKAIVGENAFAHASGIHQHGMLRHAGTYEIMRPEDVGVAESRIVLQRHSGRAAVRDVLTKAGYTLSDEEFSGVFKRFEKLAAHKKEVAVEELVTAYDESRVLQSGPYEVVACILHLDTRYGKRNAHAEVQLQRNGQPLIRIIVRSQVGEEDACLRAAQSVIGKDAVLTHFHLQSLGEGPDAVAKAWVTLERGGRTRRASATDTSSAYAALKAYVAALNMLIRAEDAGEEERTDVPGRLTI